MPRRDFGRHRRGYGQGIRLEDIPRSDSVLFEDFSGGYDSSKVGGASEKSSPLAIDVYVDAEGRIRRVPGLREVEKYTTRTLRQMAVHANLDKVTELVFFDPPFIGVKGPADTVWTDVGLPASDQYVAWTNFGSELVFSNGLGAAFARASGGATRKLLEAPPARAYASFAGRVLAANAIIEGTMEPLGVVWSGASSQVDDWQGLGGGYELLLDDLSYGDEIQSLIPMGLDQIAVSMKRSLWVGRRTGLRDRPVDFKPVVRSMGFVNRRVAVSTQVGVIGLTVDGVYAFDGSSVQHLSRQIDADLLPLDKANIRNYSSAYDPVKMEYWLFTPTETWVLDIQRGRWSRRSLKAKDAVLWSPFVKGPSWNQLVGSWGAQTGAWVDYKSEHTDELELHVLVERDGTSYLGAADEGLSHYVGVASTPFWQFPRVQGKQLDQQFTIQAVELQYLGGGLFGFRHTDMDGVQDKHSSFDLPFVTEPRTAVFNPAATGEGIGFQLDFGEGNIAISKVAVRFLPRSSRIGGTKPTPYTTTDYVE